MQLQTHPVRLSWTNDQPLIWGRYPHNTQQTWQANIHALSGIRTCDPSS